MGRKKIVIPKNGLSAEDVIQTLKEMSKNDIKWTEGKAFGYVYHIDDEQSRVMIEANNMFAGANALNPMAFPSLKQCEKEVISMTADMLNGDENVVGSLTSGGTESILMAVKTYRDWGRAKKKIKEPEIVLPISAHPAFDKAAHYFNVKLVKTPIRDDFRADVDAMRKAITKNTILVIGSACDYPKGVVDPIKEIAALAKEHKIGCHVDSCLGGFMLPWLKKLGYPIPDFDFSVDGVTSISADNHKYGFGYKGTSTILYKNKDLLKHQVFVYTEWPGGIYASTTMTGSRPGGAIAATWAVMKYLGEEGYLKAAKTTMETAQKLQKGINEIPELYVLGKPDMTVFAFGSDQLNVYKIADILQSQGWILDRLQRPRCLHCIINPDQAAVADEFLEKLRETVEHLKKQPREKVPDGTAAMYGMMERFPARGLIKKKVIDFLIDEYKSD
ncbi:MAG: pyridoxal phosphate-dependent decarboxylase family protein [Promethearchaeota archaeon]